MNDASGDWVAAAVDAALRDPTGSATSIECSLARAGDRPIGRVDIGFEWRDGLGRVNSASGIVWLPSAVRDEPSRRLPLFHAAGYELPEESAIDAVDLGQVVSTPSLDQADPANNPVCRGPNLDLTLFRLVRALGFVDRTQVVVGGGSAGGYTALMLAAEAFPLAAVTADAPVVNLCYQGAFALENERRIAADADELGRRPFLMILPPLARGAAAQYGGAVESDASLAHSPVAHAHLITCPVSAVFSTADMLVPIQQVGRGLVGSRGGQDEPGPDPLAVSDMDELVHDDRFRVRLLDALDPADVEVRRLSTPPGTAVLDWTDPDQVSGVQTFPVEPLRAPGARWVVTILDEGVPDPSMLHFRYAYLADHQPFRRACAEAGPGPEQLSAAKLDQLLRRYEGSEWMAPGFTHLADPVVERADVEDGLRAFCALSAAHRGAFESRYRHLPPARRILDFDPAPAPAPAEL